jgi:hypothetical protein
MPSQSRLSSLASSAQVVGGSVDYYTKFGTLPYGPASVEDFTDWPQITLKNIFGCPRDGPLAVVGAVVRRRRFERALEGGVAMHTDFSGKGSVETSLRMLSKAMQDLNFHVPNGWFQCWRANDNNSVCQAVWLDVMPSTF